MDYQSGLQLLYLMSLSPRNHPRHSRNRCGACVVMHVQWLVWALSSFLYYWLSLALQSTNTLEETIKARSMEPSLQLNITTLHTRNLTVRMKDPLANTGLAPTQLGATCLHA